MCTPTILAIVWTTVVEAKLMAYTRLLIHVQSSSLSGLAACSARFYLTEIFKVLVGNPAVRLDGQFIVLIPILGANGKSGQLVSLISSTIRRNHCRRYKSGFSRSFKDLILLCCHLLSVRSESRTKRKNKSYFGFLFNLETVRMLMLPPGIRRQPKVCCRTQKVICIPITRFYSWKM